MQNYLSSSPGQNWKRTYLSLVVVFLLCSSLRAEKACPVELKLLLSPPTKDSVIASLGFEKEISSQVYFFDTADLGLLSQGVILSVRQGAKNDLTVKLRLRYGDKNA